MQSGGEVRFPLKCSNKKFISSAAPLLFVLFNWRSRTRAVFSTFPKSNFNNSPSLSPFLLLEHPPAKQNRTGHEQQFISSCVRVVQYGYLAITSSNSLMDTSRRSVALFLPRLSYTPVHQPMCDIKSNCEFCGGVFGPESQLWNSQRVAIIILTDLLLLL